MTEDQRAALVALLAELDDLGYDFTTVTPRTHARILKRRAGEEARDLRDVFGWSMAYAEGLLPGPIPDLLDAAGAREPAGGGKWKSRLRVSTLDGRLFAHSAYPTAQENSIFFGPDTYRFLRFLQCELTAKEPVRHLVDLGAGSGAGGISAALMVEPERLTLADINRAALDVAAANAEAAGVEAALVEGGLEAVADEIDLIIANPPFIADPQGRAYRDGGDMLGAGLSLEWAQAGAAKLASGGAMLLYTGSPIVGGEDALLTALAEAVDEAGCTLRYEELDPDIFGEELDGEVYTEAGVERIAAVGAVIRKE
jgi:hypothetical protein